MATFRVVLVAPKAEGNVGSVARVMRNFGVEDLVLVTPPPLEDEAKERAMHAWDVIQNARTVATFDEAIAGADYVVGTSAKIPRNEKGHARNPVDGRDLVARLLPMKGTVALCFGREDFGLFNEEIEKCDALVYIPTSEKYRSLNLSHAAAVLLYEIYRAQAGGGGRDLTPMSETMKVTFWKTFDTLVEQFRLPDHKADQTKIVMRRLMGRAVPSMWEYFVFMGILSSVLEKYGVQVEGGRFEGDFDVSTELFEEFQTMLEDSSSSNS